MNGAAQHRLTALALLTAALALMLSPLRAHIDDVDAQTYLVIARNAARNHQWFDLTFLPAVWSSFREHLPFGFWPGIAAIRLLGEWAVPFVYAGLGLATLWTVGDTARRLAGDTAGAVAMLALATCESLWQYNARLLLEPPLLLCTALSVRAWVAGRPVGVTVWSALGVLVKGPFGLLPAGAIGLAELLLAPSRKRLRAGCLICAGALIPIAIFLCADRWLSDGSWWRGYVHDQLFASASGARRDGLTSPWFALRIVGGRFWPGLPLVLAGAVLATKRPGAVRWMAVACAIGLAAFCFPTRKWGNHLYVLFPMLAVLAGVAAGHWRRALPRASIAGAFALAAASIAFALLGGGIRISPPPCEFSKNPLAAQLPRAGAPIGVVGGDPLAIAELAAERGLNAVPVDAPRAGMPSVQRTGGHWVLIAPR